MCIATVDIEVVQEIYFFCFFSNTSNDSEKATYFPLFYPLREWYDIAVKYVTKSCGMWIVYEFQFLHQYTSFLAFHREPQGTSIPPWIYYIFSVRILIFDFGYWYMNSNFCGSADFSFVQVQCHCPNDTCNSYYYTIKVVPSLPCHCRNDTCLWKIEKQSNLSLQIRYTRGLLRLPEFCFEIRQRQQKWTTLP
jgi:hypothetical protein